MPYGVPLRQSESQRRDMDFSWLDFGPVDHLQLLHGQHAANVTVAYRSPVDGWQERTIDHDLAGGVIDLLVGREAEVYLSQSGFMRRRSLDSISAIPALFTDLDYRTVPGLARLNAVSVLDRIRRDLPALPPPTLSASSSAGGAYGIWVLDKPLPAERLPDWQSVQDGIYDALRPYGADSRARDATRVLRVPGSAHPSGSTVRYKQTASTYPFEQLAKAVRSLKPPAPPAQPTTSTTKGKRPARILNGFTLAHGRMIDLRQIARNRAPMADYRKRMLFVFSCCCAWFLHSTDDIARECENFARDFFKDGYRYTGKLISTTLRRFDQAKAGVRIPWMTARGVVEVDARYRLKNSSIMDMLDLDESEMNGCKVIIPAHIRRERDRERHEDRRRQQGQKDRAEYLAAAQTRKQMALDLRQQGIPVSEIAEQLGCSRRNVYELTR